jgi:hypothetical protein
MIACGHGELGTKVLKRTSLMPAQVFSDMEVPHSTYSAHMASTSEYRRPIGDEEKSANGPQPVRIPMTLVSTLPPELREISGVGPAFGGLCHESYKHVAGIESAADRPDDRFGQQR